MQLEKILRSVRYESNDPKRLEEDIEGLTYDSRKAKAGWCFVCLVGARTDGHTYARSAYEAGCRCFLVERKLDLPEDALQIRVEDTRAALPILASNFYDHPEDSLTLIGITGTKGKTTTALLIQQIMNGCQLPCGYIGTVGLIYGETREHTANTTPESLVIEEDLRRMVDAGMRFAVIEVSSQALAHHRVDHLTFDTTIFTNLSEDHIGPGEHKDFADYLHAKSLLFSDYQTRHIIANIDDPHTGEVMKNRVRDARYISLSLKEKADYTASDIENAVMPGTLGVRFTCHHEDTDTEIIAGLPGDINVYNILCAIAACGVYGPTVKECSVPLRTAHADGRCEVIPTETMQDRHFVLDYAHNGVSLTAALDLLRSYHPHRLIALFGSVGDRTQLRRKELGEAADTRADVIILTADNPGHEDPLHVIKDIHSHITHCKEVYECPDRKDAIRKAVMISQPGDIILLSGKGHEDYQLIGDERVPFSEKKIVQELTSEH